MENHKEKLAIFNEYAKSKGHNNWITLHSRCDYAKYLSHLFNATDLVQQEALKRASENISMKFKDN